MSQVLLPRTGILSFMDDESRGQLAAYGTIVSTTPGQIILREGEANTNLYVVLGGTFDIATKAPTYEVHLDTVGEGDCLGEVAVFQPGPTSATVTSAGDGRQRRGQFGPTFGGGGVEGSGSVVRFGKFFHEIFFKLNCVRFIPSSTLEDRG
jgi:predicted lipoprotein